MSIENDLRAKLRHSLAAIKKLKGEVERLKSRPMEPIAVVGMACRLPGNVDSPEAFWQVLSDGVDAIVEVPKDRWDVDAYYDPDPETRGKICTRSGGFLSDIDLFDAQFFGIAPREAVRLDPQHRLVLEVSWTALEHAGINPFSLKDSATAVFLGICNTDYAGLLLREREDIDAYVGTGNAHSTAAGRLSFFLGLRGPSVAVDTACSSSLVGVHLACQSLRERETDLVLAGGVNVLLSPEYMINFSQARMLAADGRCKAFDARANGYARSEGCGIVVLKRLSDALDENDRILAVIRGSAVNQDGKSSGLTVPNGPAQEDVIRRALTRAGVQPGDVEYVEAHGTGTALGDPIEFQALHRVFGTNGNGRPLTIGAVKTNVGHLEAAAGVTGLIKTILCLQNGEIPGNLHFHSLNPQIQVTGSRLRIAAERQPWLRHDTNRVAGVSSFGFSGTNAHLVLEEAPRDEAATADRGNEPQILPLSARTQRSLEQLRSQYTKFLQSAICLPSVCYTAQTGRAHFEQRLAVVGRSPLDMASSLEGGGFGNRRSLIRRELPSDQLARVAFLFSGQSSQYAGMGGHLFKSEPVFRKTLTECDEILKPILSTSLLDVLYSADHKGLLDETLFAQPALFAVGAALADLWRAWGIVPNAVLGHSIGEYAAGHVAGVFSLEDGLKLVAERARLAQALPAVGAMATVGLDATEIQPLLAKYPLVFVGAINGSRRIVLSGPSDCLERILETLRDRKVACKRLNISRAFHSPAMESIVEPLRRFAETVKFQSPSIDFFSTITGGMANEEVAHSAYWVDQLSAPTRFLEGMSALRARGANTFVEIGPDPVLLSLGMSCIPDADTLWLPSLRARKHDREQVLQSLGRLYVNGVDVNWKKLESGDALRKVNLPTYPFDRRKYWVKTTPGHPPQPENSAGRIDHYLYEEQWWIRDRDQSQSSRPGVYVVLADRSGVGQSLAARLCRDGHQVVQVYAADMFCQYSDLAFGVEPSTAAHYEKVWQFLYQHHSSIQAIVHLWALDSPAPHSLTADDLAQLQHCQVLSILPLVRTMKQPGRAAAPLWIVTRAAIGAPADAILEGISQSPLWGVGKTLALEHPELSGGIIDLSPVPSENEIDLLAADLTAPDRERWIAFRGGQRYVPRLERAHIRAATPVRISREGTYLITGGTGHLGSCVARWLVRKGAQKIALMSRRGAAKDSVRKEIQEWRAQQISVEVYEGDVGDAADVARVWQEIAARQSPVSGIVHAAGVVEEAAVLDASESGFEAVMRPKLSGAWNLHRVSQDVEIEFFILFSSIAAVWGSKGLAAYAAGNQFMDTLAHYRRQHGLPALSVNWGPWADGGMASAEAAANLKRSGASPLSLEVCIRLLEQFMAAGVTQISAVAVDWDRFKPVYETIARHPLLESVGSREQPQNEGRRDGLLLNRLRNLPSQDRDRLLGDFLRREVARVLGFEDGTLPDPRRSLFELGIDSLMAVELKRTLERDLEVQLPSTIVFDYPSIQDLAAHLASRVFLKCEVPVANPAPNNDVAALLAAKLREIREAGV